jgi:hypothetical protein
VGDFSPILNRLPPSVIVAVGMWATRFAMFGSPGRSARTEQYQKATLSKPPSRARRDCQKLSEIEGRWALECFFVLLSWFLFVPAQVRGIQDHCRHPVGNAIMNLRRKDVVLAAGKKVERAGVRPVVHD